MEAPTAVVLAAGKGTRMNSDLPKVLHRLGGLPLVQYPMRAARTAGATRVVVVVGHGADDVRAAVQEAVDADDDVRFAEQHEQLGTGHAVLCALRELDDVRGPILVLSGDVPLLRAESITRLVEAWRTSEAGLSLAIFRPAQTHGYGRILRDSKGRVVCVREQRDASPGELAIRDCNAGTYCIDADFLRRELPRLGQGNAQGEVYLTDLVARAAERGAIASVMIDPIEAAGVNTPEQLEALSGHLAAKD